MRSARGSGSVRQRRPDVWEVRVALGPDPVSGRSRRRSITVHGDAADAATARARWSDAAGLLRRSPGLRPAIGRRPPHGVAGRRSRVAAGHGDGAAVDHRLPGPRSAGVRRAIDVSPPVLRAACVAWRSAGVPEPTVSARVRVLRSALGYAYAEGVIDRFPLAGMRGPRQPGSRLHASVEAVRALIRHAEDDVLAARHALDGTAGRDERLHRPQQVLLLVRLAADTRRPPRRARLPAFRRPRR